MLMKSSNWMIKSLSTISKQLGWDEFFAAFFLVAFSTSLPEFFVGISSALHRLPQLSFGNLIGANIVNLTLGTGLAVLLTRGIKVNSETAKKESIFTAVISFLPILLMLDGGLSRIDGLILIFVFIFYFKKLFKSQKHSLEFYGGGERKNWKQFKKFLKDIGLFFGSLVLLLLSAEGVVRTINFLAVEINIPLVIASSVLVGLGTTLPEMIFSVKAAMFGKSEMSLGNFMGSVVINSTLILGIVSLISPLKVIDFSPYMIGFSFTLIIAVFFAIFLRTGKKITKKEALALIAIYASFVLFQVFLGIK